MTSGTIQSRVAARWLAGAGTDPEKFLEALGKASVKLLDQRLEATKEKFQARGRASFVKEKTRTGWELTVMLDGGSHDGRGHSMALSLKVRMDASDEVGLSTWSNFVHRLRAARVPSAKAKTEAMKFVKDLGESWDSFAKSSGPVTIEDPLAGIKGVLRRIKLGPAGKALKVEVEGPTEWRIDPDGRQRGDHFRGDWDEEYVQPVVDAVEHALALEFGSGMFAADVGEKGHIYVTLTQAGKTRFALG